MKKLGTLLGCALLLFGMTGCSAGYASTPDTKSDEQSKSEPEPVVNTDPRKGKVIINIDGTLVKVWKLCDGTTLLYVTPGYNSGAHGIDTIANSPECQPN